MRSHLLIAGLAAVLVWQANPFAQQPANPFASTYQATASRPTLIRNATILTAAGAVAEASAAASDRRGETMPDIESQP